MYNQLRSAAINHSLVNTLYSDFINVFNYILSFEHGLMMSVCGRQGIQLYICYYEVTRYLYMVYQ